MVVISKDLREPMEMFYLIHETHGPMVVHSREDQHRLASTRAQTGNEFVSCTLQKCCQTDIKFTSSIHPVSCGHAADRAQSGKANSMVDAQGRLSSNLL